MRQALRGGLVAAALLFCVSAVAQTPAPAPAPPVPDDELAELFSTFCLDAFPAEAILAKAAGGRHGVAMTPDQVKSLLHDDPGRGWMLRTSQALYGVTVEYPPYSACAVRRMTPNGVSGVLHYIAALNRYVAAKQGKLVSMPPQKTAQNGVDFSMFGHGMLDANGKLTDNFIVILSNYHGRAGGIWRADAGSGVGVEVRFVHQLVRQ